MILSVIFVFAVILKHADIPIMSWGEAIRDQVNAKWWLLALIGVEILRQLHYVISSTGGRTTSSG